MLVRNCSSETARPKLPVPNSSVATARQRTLPAVRSVENAAIELGCPYQSPTAGYGELVWADSVADGCSDADDVVVAEIDSVVHDVIVVSLWADEDVSPEVVAEAAANINKEVVAAVVAGAEIDATAGIRIAIEAGALPADAAQEVKAYLLAELGLIIAVECKDNRAIRNAQASIVPLAASPCGFKGEADPFVKNDVSADAGIEASFFGNEATPTGDRA